MLTTILLFDIVYIVQYLVNVTIFFWGNARKNLHLERKSKIILIIDLFFAFPYSYIYEGVVGRDFYDNGLLILRGIVFFRLMHSLIFLGEVIQRAGGNHIKDFLIQCALFFMLFQQTFACVLYIMAWSYSIEEVEDRWTSIGKLRRTFTDPMEHYAICLCYVLFNISQRTFGIVVPKKPPEQILFFFITMVGFTITTGMFIGVLSFLYEKSFQRKSLWEKKDGVHKAPTYPQLPSSVISEIFVDINIQHLQRSAMFRDKPDAFLRAVSSLMRHEFYMTGEFIYHANVIKHKMIFVVSGMIKILSDEDNESTIITFGAGTCLGEASLALTLPSKCTAKAACYTELQVLYRRDFNVLMDLFPEIYTKIQESIMQRIANARDKISQEDKVVSISIHSYLETESKATIRILKEKLRGHIPITDEDKYLFMYKLDDESMEEETSRIFLTSKFPLIIEPHSALHQAWTFIVVLVVFYIAIAYPYYIVFLRQYSSIVLAIFQYIDAILLIDFFLVLHIAIKEKNNTIKMFTQIMRKRLTQPGFYLDFLSFIKFEALCLPFSEHNTRFCDVWRLNRLLKCYRVPRLINTIDHTLKGPVLALRLTKYLLYLLMTIYWFGALLYLITCFDLICTNDGWYFLKLQKDVRDGLVSSYSRNPMLTAIYYSLHYVTSPSFDDVVARNILDMMMGYIATTFGLLTLGYCVAELTATITRQRKILTQYQEYLFSLIRFMKEKKIPKSIIQRVENFFVVQWNYDEGARMKGSLFFNANKNIQRKVEMAEKWNILVNLPVLRDRNYDFLQHLVMEAVTIIFPPNEIIHYKEEINTILYIIQEGYCVRTDVGTEVYGPRSYFGSLSIFTNVNSITTVKALTHVKMLCIPYDSLWKCAAMFPMVDKQFKETIEKLNLREELEKARKMKTADFEIESDDFKGSFINVLKYCRTHDENYGEPFLYLSYMSWFKYLLIPVCILPDGKFLKVWMAMRLIVACIVALLTPYALTQYPHASLAVRYLLLACDIVAYIDLYVMMFVGFYGSKHQLIFHPFKTAANYLKGKFLIDVVLCFPWEVLSLNLDKHHKTGISYTVLIRTVRVFQIYRLPQFFNYLSSDIRQGGNIMQMAKFLSIIIVTINFCAAFLIQSTCSYYSKDDFPSSAIYNNSYIEASGLMRRPLDALDPYAMFCKVQSWIDRSEYQNMSANPFYLYMVAVYFCSSTVTTCGFGDILPQYPVTLILTILMIIFGYLFFGYIYAQISSHKADWRTLQLKQQAIVLELKHFMMSENVDEDLRRDIIDRLEYRWKRTRGAEPNEILANVNDTLHEDAVLSMYGNVLSEVPLFKNVDKSFLRIIGKIVTESYYLKNEPIYEAEDVVWKICILYRGTVKITRPGVDDDIYMGRGGIFGNISYTARNKISVTVTAVTKVDLLIVESQRLFGILKKYPLIKQKIESAMTNTDFIKPISEKDYDIQVLQEVTEKEDFEELNFKECCWRCFQIISGWKTFRTSIPPNSLIWTIMDLTCLILAYFDCLSLTYEFSFLHHGYILMAKSIFVDITFLIRVLLNMHKSYEDDFGEPVESNKLILKRYFHERKLRRWIDIISNIPFHYIVFLLRIQQPFMCFSGIRLITICRFLIYIDYYEEKSFQLFAKTSRLKIITLVLWVSLTIHIFACGWYLCACPLGDCYEDGWTSKYVEDPKDKLSIYISCMYFMSGLFTACSHGDILPHTFTEQIYVTIVIILANFLIGIFIGDIMNSLNSATLARVNYEQGIKRLELYLRNCNLSDFQMEKLTNYVRQLWSISDGNQTPRALSQLHFKTAHDLMNKIYGQHIKSVYVFKDVEEAFIRQLTLYLRRNLYFKGDYIVKHGDSDKSMYFIHSGEIDILTVHPNLTETVHEVLRAGEAFGIMQGLFPGVPHHFSYRARTKVHTVNLCLSDWDHLLNFFPDSKAAIYRNADTVYT